MKNHCLHTHRIMAPYLAIIVLLLLLALIMLAVRYGNAFGIVLPQTFGVTFFCWLLVIVLAVMCIFVFCRMINKYKRAGFEKERRNLIKKNTQKEMDLLRGLHITVIGGGTGLSTILRGLKQISSHISAVVTVTDDGGSSGRLLDENMVIPPGDIRNCLVALSPREGIMEKLFNYRFDSPEELKGHSLGNLMIRGLADITGDTAAAVQDIGRILNIRGSVIPVTLDDVTLGAVMEDGESLLGETTIVDDPRRIKKMFLTPRNTLVNADAITAIMDADVVLLGPGSLYTSVIPNLLVPGIVEALLQTKAPVWYVSNLMTQRGETEAYNLSDHIEAIVSLGVENFLDGVIINTEKVTSSVLTTYKKGGLSQVENDMKAVKKYGLHVAALPLANEDGFVKHDAEVLAEFIASGKFLR